MPRPRRSAPAIASSIPTLSRRRSCISTANIAVPGPGKPKCDPGPRPSDAGRAMPMRAAIAALSLLLSTALAFAQNPEVPKKHQALFSQLQGQLAAFASQIPAASSPGTVLRGAAWIAAGCDPVPTLLDELRRQRALRELDALRQAGVQL